MRGRTLLWIALILLLYSLPWVVNPGVSLTFGGYDLAEWASLHHAARAESPPLLTSFLLRLPLALAAALIGLSGKGQGETRLFSLAAILLIAVALLPPLEFTQAPDDPNYRQEALVAGIALIGGLAGIGISARTPRFAPLVSAVIGIVGAGAVIAGLNSAYGLLRGFELPVGLGIGGLGLAGVFAAAGAINLWSYRRSGEQVC
jgi:hypothetical protein